MPEPMNVKKNRDQSCRERKIEHNKEEGLSAGGSFFAASCKAGLYLYNYTGVLGVLP